MVANDAAHVLVKQTKIFNSLVQEEILGGGAFQKKKLKHINSRHLALASNCIAFVLDQLPFFKS